MPWKIIISLGLACIWFGSFYVLASEDLSIGGRLNSPIDKDSALGVILFMIWTLIVVVVARKIGDPMTGKLSHPEYIISVAESLLSKYERDRRDVLLVRYDVAGGRGYKGGPGNMKFDTGRVLMVKVKEFGEESISEILRLQSVRPSSRLRILYYGIAGSVDKVEIEGKKVDRFLRSKGVDPEDVAPTRPLPEQ